MRRTAFILGLTLLLAAGAFAAEGEGPKPYIQLSGFYAFDGYSQNNFFLGKGAVGGVSDKDEYSIQILRVMADFGLNENLKAVVRVDLGQSIWGIDNSQRDTDRPGFSNLFNNKDTNFEVHVDWAYVDYTHSDWKLNAKLGRQHFSLGNLLVLDQDNDGILLTRKLERGGLTFGWSKMFEGQDSLSDDGFAGGKDYRDADLYLLSYAHKSGGWSVNPFLAYYDDKGTADASAYLPQGLQYFNARFRPQVAEAQALGVAFTYSNDAWSLKGEADYLQGDDDIANTNSGPNQLLDVNNGNLEGYNLYFDAKRKLGPGQLGFVVGLGSGDDDLTSGKGNLNKIRTNGFFYVTEVWEDSIMPDELGITPQGLGSPASRGYRELENTTLLQLNYTWNLSSTVKLFASGTWVQATEELHPWSDGNGDGVISPDEFGSESSDDLGTELDLKLDWKITPALTWTFRGGLFMPGDAAGYLINGTSAYDDDAYELRTTIQYSFGGLKLGG